MEQNQQSLPLNRQQRRQMEREQKKNQKQLTNLPGMQQSQNFEEQLMQLSPEEQKMLRDLKENYENYANGSHKEQETKDLPPNTGGSEDSSRRKRRDKFSKLQEDLEILFAGSSITLGTLGQTMKNEALVLDGKTLLIHSSTLAERWVEVARQYPSVFRILKMIAESSAIGLLVAEHFAIMREMANNHASIRNVSQPDEESVEAR